MIYLIYLFILVSFIDTFSQLPIVSPYALSLGAIPLVIGLIIGAYSFTNIIGNIISGYYIDNKGVKGVASIGLLATAFILFGYTLVTTPTQLFFIRLFHGLAGGLLVPASFSFLSKMKTDRKQSIRMAYSGATVGLASIIGPAFGGIVSHAYSVNVVFASVGVLMFIMALLVIFVFPRAETNPVAKKSSDSVSTLIVMKNLFKEPILRKSYAGVFLLTFAMGTLAYLLPLKIESLGFNSSLSGILLSTFAIVATLIFTLPTNQIYERFPKAKVMTVGITILGVCLLLLGLVITIPLHFVVMILYGIGFALIFPTMSGLVTEGSRAEERGMAFGIFYGIFSFGIVVGSFVTGLFTSNYTTPFFIAGAVLLIGSVLLWRSLKIK